MKKFITITMSMIMVVSTATAAFAATESETRTAVTVSPANSTEIDIIADEIQNKDGVLITKVKETSKNNEKATMYSGIMNKQEFKKVLDKIGKSEKEKEEALKQYDDYYKVQNSMTIKTKNEEIPVDVTTTKKDTTAQVNVTYKFDDENYNKNFEKFNKVLTDEFINTAVEMGYLTESSVEFSIETIEAIEADKQ